MVPQKACAVDGPAAAGECAAGAQGSLSAGGRKEGDVAFPGGLDVDAAQLEALSKAELVELVRAYAKNVVALDGVWFQSLEREEGMDVAMHHNDEAWKRFPASDARRLKKLLGLGEHPGLEGLAAALPYKFNSIANHYDLAWKDGALVYRVLDCRVQTARTRKGMPLHPCKQTGACEFRSFCSAIDDRIVSECVSCYPDLTDESCSCSWKFTVAE